MPLSLANVAAFYVPAGFRGGACIEFPTCLRGFIEAASDAILDGMSTRRRGARDATSQQQSERQMARPKGHPLGSPASASDESPHGERMQKYLAHAGIASRRHAEELIRAGEVTVNGQVVRELGTRVAPGRDEVRVRGELVRAIAEEERLYVLLNKPVDTVTTARDERGRRTVLDLLPEEWRARRVYPVGRLDRDTEGLLLLTNDGDLALRLAHPRYALEKEYHALVAGHPPREALERLARGIALEEETRPTAPAQVRTLRQAGPDTWLALVIHEGRKRQVRRMLEVVGHPVRRLRRVRVGSLVLGELPAGQARLLSDDEVRRLRQQTGLALVE
jgi:23S rRNA pseudouridine2605 synthase